MKCEDCGFEYEKDGACPRCGYEASVDLTACVRTENVQVTNPLEEELGAFCQKMQNEPDGEAKIRERWRQVDRQAKKGNLDARHVIARVALSRKEYESAHRILAGLADAGHVLARVDLARLYEEGLGVEKDVFDAIRLYRLAAAKGNPIALFKLAEQHGGAGVLRPDGPLANGIMQALVARYPHMFQRRGGCNGSCANGPTAGEFAVRSASQMTKLVKYLVILGLVAFVAYIVWSELHG